MRSYLLAYLIVAAACWEPDKFPEYTINLDLPPEQRWIEVARDKREEILAIYCTIMGNLDGYSEQLVNLFTYTAWIWDYTNHEQYKEIQGIVEGLNHPNITQAKAVLVNSIYELGAWCTSIVVKQANGTIIHSRNLDYDFGDQMRAVTIKA